MDTITPDDTDRTFPALEEMRDHVVSLLTDSEAPIPRGDVIRTLGRRREAAYVAINSLIEDGQVVIVRGPRNRADLVLAQG